MTGVFRIAIYAGVAIDLALKRQPSDSKTTGKYITHRYKRSVPSEEHQR